MPSDGQADRVCREKIGKGVDRIKVLTCLQEARSPCQLQRNPIPSSLPLPTFPSIYKYIRQRAKPTKAMYHSSH